MHLYQGTLILQALGKDDFIWAHYVIAPSSEEAEKEFEKFFYPHLDRHPFAWDLINDKVIKAYVAVSQVSPETVVEYGTNF